MTKAEMMKEYCLTHQSINPIEIAMGMMDMDGINIHGPEHHILDGAAFLCAMHCAGAVFDLEKALDEMMARGSKMPGATCGQWGVCGSVSSIGAALAIIHETGPLSSNEFYKDNMRLTSKALAQLAEIGGPRCCKRNAFISLKTAITFVKEQYNIELEDMEVKCQYSPKNAQCIHRLCPFSKEK